MKLGDVLSIIEGKLISQDVDMDMEIQMGCGADLMSDVLSFTHEGTLLMSGLTNPQVVRTAEVAGINAIVFVRGKIRWSDKAFREFKRRIREFTGRSWFVSMEYRFFKLAEYVRGWMNYYGISEYYRPIPLLDEWLRRRVRMWHP